MGLFNKKKELSEGISDKEKQQNSFFTDVFDQVDQEIEAETKERRKIIEEQERERNEHIRKVNEAELSLICSEFKGSQKPINPKPSGDISLVIDGLVPYTLVINEFEDVSEDEYFIGGKVVGEMLTDSDAFIYLPTGSFVKAHINKIYNSNLDSVDLIRNEEVKLKVSMSGSKNKIPRFAVISSLVFVSDDKQSLTNPLMYAYSIAYKDMYKFSEFSQVFIYTFVHTKFTVPAMLSPDGKNGLLLLKNKQDESRADIPLFTDIGILKRVEKALNTQGGQNKGIASVTFNGLAQGLVNSGNGLVINPFTQYPVVIPNDLIVKITELDSYRKEFNLGNPQ